LLAIAVFAGLYGYGMPEPGTRLRTVAEGTAAYQAGLRGGERITAVNGAAVQTWGELRWEFMHGVLDKAPVRLEVERKAADGAAVRETLWLPTSSVSASDFESDFLAALGLDLARPPA